MAKEKGEGSGAKLWGPYVSKGDGDSLGYEAPNGVPSPKDPPDPLGLLPSAK